MLLEDLVKATPPLGEDDAGSFVLEESLSEISNLASCMNEGKRDSESRRRLVQYVTYRFITVLYCLTCMDRSLTLHCFICNSSLLFHFVTIPPDGNLKFEVAFHHLWFNLTESSSWTAL